MIITHLNAGRKAEIFLQGTVLTIAEQIKIDLAEQQSDTQKVVDVCLDSQLQTMQIGLGAWYVATVIIPARQFDLVNDEQVAHPIDLSQVECRLWALPEKYKTMATEEDE